MRFSEKCAVQRGWQSHALFVVRPGDSRFQLAPRRDNSDEIEWIIPWNNQKLFRPGRSHLVRRWVQH